MWPKPQMPSSIKIELPDQFKGLTKDAIEASFLAGATQGAVVTALALVIAYLLFKRNP
jgi:hypothetical protein